LGRRRVGFQAYSVHLAQFYRPLIDRLRERSDVEVSFVVLAHPHFPRRTWGELRRYARSELKLPNRSILPYWRATREPFDLMVCADVFASLPPRTEKSCVLMHGAGLTSRVASRGPFRKSVLDFDVALVCGDHDLELLGGLSHRSPFEVRATGLPLLDEPPDTTPPRSEYLRGLELDDSRKTVLFAPSWRALRAMGGRGEVHFDEVLAQLRRLDANVLVKLHACSFNRIMAGGFDWKRKVAGVREAGAVGVDLDVDDVPASHHSEVLVTDISSRAFNFMYLGKPVVLCAPGFVPLDEWDRQRWNLIRKGCLVALETGEVAGRVAAALSGEVSPNLGRAVAARCFAHAGRSADAVVDALLEAISTPGDPRLAASNAARARETEAG
jgi:hypothetical protein